MGKKKARKLYESGLMTNSGNTSYIIPRGIGKTFGKLGKAATSLAKPLSSVNKFIKDYNYLDKKITDPEAQDLLGLYKNQIPTLGLYKDREAGKVMRDFNNIMKAGLRKYDLHMSSLPRKLNGDIDDEQMSKDFKKSLTDPDYILKYDPKKGRYAGMDPRWAALKDFEGTKIGSNLTLNDVDGRYGMASVDFDHPFLGKISKGKGFLFAKPVDTKMSKLFKYKNRNSKSPYQPIQSMVSNLRREIDGEDTDYIDSDNLGSKVSPGVGTALGVINAVYSPDTAEQVAKELGVFNGKTLADRKLAKLIHQDPEYFWIEDPKDILTPGLKKRKKQVSDEYFKRRNDWDFEHNYKNRYLKNSVTKHAYYPSELARLFQKTQPSTKTISKDDFWSAVNSSKFSESIFSKKPDIDLKKISQYASEIFNKFGSVFKSKKGKDCEEVVNEALSSENPNQVLRNFISSTTKDKDTILSKIGNALHTWLDMADYAYNIAVKRNKNKLFCILMYAFVILTCFYISIPSRLLLPFANHNVSNKKIWKKYASSWGWPGLLFNFILTLYAVCVVPDIIARVFSGDTFTIMFLIIFNVIFHQSGTPLSEPIN